MKLPSYKYREQHKNTGTPWKAHAQCCMIFERIFGFNCLKRTCVIYETQKPQKNCLSDSSCTVRIFRVDQWTTIAVGWTSGCSVNCLARFLFTYIWTWLLTHWYWLTLLLMVSGVRVILLLDYYVVKYGAPNQSCTARARAGKPAKSSFVPENVFFSFCNMCKYVCYKVYLLDGVVWGQLFNRTRKKPTRCGTIHPLPNKIFRLATV